MKVQVLTTPWTASGRYGHAVMSALMGFQPAARALTLSLSCIDLASKAEQLKP